MSEKVEIPQSTAQELIRWYTEDLIRSTSFLKGTFFGWFFGLFRQAAVTAPDLSSRSGVVLLGHELYHVLQQREIGWGSFLLRYLWDWRPWHVTQGRKHSLEESAYTRSDEISNVLSL